MRILHVTPFYEPACAYGGMARSSAALCRALARRGHEVTVATARLSPADPMDETLGGVRVRRFAGPTFLADRLVPWACGLGPFLKAVLREIDIVHLHGHRSGLAVVASRVLSAAGRNWILLTSGTYPDHGQHRMAKALFDRLVGRRVVDGAAGLIAVSEAEARDLPRPARVIPNGVEAPGSAGRTRTSGRPRLLFVGNDSFQKRGHVLPALLLALPEAELHLVGRFAPRFLTAFDAFAGRVTAVGVLGGDTLAAAYADADLVVHPAAGEAFGMVPFEAALCGTASVVAGGHGCGEWYGRAGGCVVPPDDAAALTQAVRVRLADRSLGSAEARAVAGFAGERLTWDQAAEATLALYREIAPGCR